MKAANGARIARALREIADAIEDKPPMPLVPPPAKIVVTEADKEKIRKALRRMGEKV